MWINVKDSPYNAQGNGTADDTAAIQAAINAAQVAATPDERNVVYFPNGMYRITATLEVYRNQGLRFVGVGNVAGLPAYVGGYAGRQTGAILYWDGGPGGILLRLLGAYDGAIENLTFVGATPQKYLFDDGTGSSDPGATKIRFNSGTFANVTQIYANVNNFFNVDIAPWLDILDSGTAGRLTIQREFFDDFAIFDVNGASSGSGTWRTINVLPVQASGTGTFPDDAVLIISFTRTGGSPQRYTFSSTTTDSDPGAGYLRFNHGTFVSIDKIFADDLSFSAFNMAAWLDSIAGADVRVTVQKINDDTITRIFKVNSVADSTGYRTINVTPIHSAGTLNDNDPVVLICSKGSPIRDRAGALVAQVSETGWPSGGTLIEHCTFLDAEDGLQLDDDETPTNNCADNTVIHCSFTQCKAGIKANWEQVVNNTVINCDFNDCDIGIDHAKGGDLRVFGASMNGFTGGTFLSIAGGGPNASAFVLSGIRLEMKAGKPSLIETSGPEPKNILIDGFAWTGVEYPASEYGSGTTYSLGAQTRIGDTIYESLQNSNTNHAPATSPTWWRWLGDWVRPVRLGQQTNCAIRGALIRGPFANVEGDGSAKSSLHLDKCRIQYDEPDTVLTDADAVWRRSDCTDFNCVPLADTGNWPNVLTQTWNSSGTTFTARKLNVTDTASASGSPRCRSSG